MQPDVEPFARAPGGVLRPGRGRRADPRGPHLLAVDAHGPRPGIDDAERQIVQSHELVARRLCAPEMEHHRVRAVRAQRELAEARVDRRVGRGERYRVVLDVAPLLHFRPGTIRERLLAPPQHPALDRPAHGENTPPPAKLPCSPVSRSEPSSSSLIWRASLRICVSPISESAVTWISIWLTTLGCWDGGVMRSPPCTRASIGAPVAPGTVPPCAKEGAPPCAQPGCHCAGPPG